MKRKILIFVENGAYPADTRVRNEALALRRNGYEVTVVSPKGKGCHRSYEVVDGVRVYRHPHFELESSRLGYFVEYGMALLFETVLAWWIYLRHGFHVIQGCNPPDDIFLVALPFKLFNVKYIFDHHDANPELYESKYNKRGFLYRVLCWLEKMNYRFSDVVMATNASYEDLAISRGGHSPDDVFIVRNGPDEEFRAVPLTSALKYGKPFLVGYVGNMDTQDGLDILLDVASRVREMGRQDVHFTCVGGGPQLAALREMVQAKNLQEMVNFTGRVPDQALLDVLSTADVCVNPDKPCQMNNISTMIKIMEYMALGKPIVQFDSKEGRFSAQGASLYSNGEDHVNDFADKVLWLLDHPEDRRRMGQIGRERIEQALAWKHSVPNLLAAYERAYSKREMKVRGRTQEASTQTPLKTYKILSDYFRTELNPRVVCHDDSAGNKSGFFRFGEDLLCFGECATGVAGRVEDAGRLDAFKASRVAGSEIHLPFNISKVIENLRRERYVRQMNTERIDFFERPFIRTAYYLVREQLPVWARRHLQIAYLRDWQNLSFPKWPVDSTVDSLHKSLLRMAMQAAGCDKVPFIWFWPQGASNCLIITHDVEAVAGRDFTSTLIDIDLSYGFKASFQVIPEERYQVTDTYANEIKDRGFEFNIHDLNHDGHLFEQKAEFLRRARKINEYGKKYGARGFRSGAMYRNQDWFGAFEFSYDMSVPSVAHLEPQRGGCCTVMPYFIGDILELPLTTSQDYTVFHILSDYSIELWKKQISVLQERNGLLSFIAHPDYLINRRCQKIYESLLAYLRGIIDQGTVWETLPGEVDRWWRARAQMKLVQDGNGYRIEGPESERARVAYASLDGDQIVYTIDQPPLITR